MDHNDLAAYDRRRARERMEERAATYTLVMHFNAFTGKLEGGYLMTRGGMKGATMTAAAVLAHMAANPDQRCDPLKV